MGEFEISIPTDSKQTWHTSHAFTMAVALLFMMIGLDKFTSDGQWGPMFARIGFGEWFRYFTACTQITGATLLIVRRTSLLGAFLLAATMVGAVIAQIFVLDGIGAAVVP